MDAESYLHWLGTTDLENARVGDLRLAVDAVTRALQEEGSDDAEMMLALAPLLEILDDGRVPLEGLRNFREEFLNHAGQYDSPDVVLERELREIALGIAHDRWATETYLALENAISSFLEGGEENELWMTVDGIEALIERVSDSYGQTSVLPKEVTMESAITHKMLVEGIEEWQAALDCLRDDSDGEPNWDEVLAKAETGNRLLVAVQIYHSRLRTALSNL